MPTDPRTYLFDLPAAGRPEAFHLKEELYPGVRDHWEEGSTGRIVDPITGIRAIVIHATGGATSAGAMSVLKAHASSWHWLVPDENEEEHGKFVWACIPEARAAWHMRNDKSHHSVNGGKDRANHWSLSIEIVNKQTNGSTHPFSGWQVEMTADIVRYCWAKYPNLKHVVSHAALDPQRHSDPGSHFPWATFKELVLSSARNELTMPRLKNVIPMNLLPEATGEIC
jgi:N-acetyl-anhydromuramyl-L-alanine amidase AmpD